MVWGKKDFHLNRFVFGEEGEVKCVCFWSAETGAGKKLEALHKKPGKASITHRRAWIGWSNLYYEKRDRDRDK